MPFKAVPSVHKIEQQLIENRPETRVEYFSGSLELPAETQTRDRRKFLIINRRKHGIGAVKRPDQLSSLAPATCEGYSLRPESSRQYFVTAIGCARGSVAPRPHRWRRELNRSRTHIKE
jgi:hypothetical protein